MSSIIRCRSGLTVLVSLMESSFLIEVDNTSILRTRALHCYHYTLNRLPAPRLLLPCSGLERSDFVRWPIAPFPRLIEMAAAAKSGGQPPLRRSARSQSVAGYPAGSRRRQPCHSASAKQ